MVVGEPGLAGASICQDPITGGSTPSFFSASSPSLPFIGLEAQYPLICSSLGQFVELIIFGKFCSRRGRFLVDLCYVLQGSI